MVQRTKDTLAKYALVPLTLVTAFLFFGQSDADAQVIVTQPTAVQPVVTYFPERRGLLFPRVVYRPAITFAPTAVQTTYYPPVAAPSAPVNTFFAPTAPQAPVTTYYAPAPVTTYYAPAPIRRAPVFRAPITTYYPPPITTYYPPVVIQ